MSCLKLAGMFVLGLCSGCTTPNAHREAPSQPRTYSSFDVADKQAAQQQFQLGALNFQNTDLTQVLAIYQQISARTVIRPTTLPAVPISLRNETPLSKAQALQLLDTVLAQNGIAMVLAGETGVKAVPVARAPSEAPPEVLLPWKDLPDSSSYMMRRVLLKGLRPSEVAPVLAPLSGMPNSILAIDNNGELILRDYSSNIRKMLQLLEELERKPGR